MSSTSLKAWAEMWQKLMDEYYPGGNLPPYRHSNVNLRLLKKDTTGDGA